AQQLLAHYPQTRTDVLGARFVVDVHRQIDFAVMERVFVHDWVDASTTQSARQSVAEIVPTTDLDTNRRCRWFEVAPATVVMVDRCSRTVLENPSLPLAQLTQALNQFRVLDWIERHVDLLVLLQFHHSAFANDASKVQYAVSLAHDMSG